MQITYWLYRIDSDNQHVQKLRKLGLPSGL
jgi:hypothetical protein